MPNFDPHPANLLGKNILDPSLETRILAEGCTFARIIDHGNGKTSVQGTVGAPGEVATRMFLDAAQRRRKYVKRPQIVKSDSAAPVQAG